MSAHPSLAPLLESFFRNRLAKQRNASPATITSYRDALRMLILFAAEQTGRKPCALAVEDLDRDLVLAFLDEIEKKRKNTIQTRNARLTAIRSFFHHVAASDPASLGIAQRVLVIPVKKSHTEVAHHLARQELDALIDAPDQRTRRGRRDRTLLLSSREPARAFPKRSGSTPAIFSSIGHDHRCSCAARDARNGSCRSPRISPKRCRR